MDPEPVDVLSRVDAAKYMLLRPAGNDNLLTGTNCSDLLLTMKKWGRGRCGILRFKAGIGSEGDSRGIYEAFCENINDDGEVFSFAPCFYTGSNIRSGAVTLNFSGDGNTVGPAR